MAKGIPDAEKRRMIMDRSGMLFLERGVSALTMEKIASLQGISKKTLYRFFPNKDALITAVVEDRIGLVAKEVARIAADSSITYLDRLRGILQAVSTQFAQISQTFIKDVYYCKPELWEKIDKFRREHVFIIITRLFEEGRKKGFIRGDIDAHLMPTLFISAINSIITPAQMLQLSVPPAKLFDAFVRIFYGGILTDDAQRKFFTQEGKI
jgi:AcrR family transcriptional regulator